MAEKVVVQLVLDTSRYKTGASNAARDTAKIRTAADKTSKSVSSLGGTALKAGAALGAAFAAKAVLDFAKSSIAAFSNLEESVNAVNVVYGEAAEGVHKLGEDSVEQFGLSTRAVNDAAVGLGAFVGKINEADPADAFENIIQRATDFASVMNIETGEALDKFRAGLSGESEPLKRFGINVSEANVKLFALESGLIASGEQMDEATKIQARYGFIMQETAKTAGDFANTSDGLAGSQKKLSAQWEEAQAQIGKALEPAMIALLDVATELIPIITKVAIVVGDLITELAPLFGVLADLVTITGDYGVETDKAADSTDSWLKALFRWKPIGDEAATTARDLTKETERLALANRVLRIRTIDLKDAIENQNAAARDSGPALTSGRSHIVRLGAAAQTAAGRFQAQADAMRDVARAAAETASPLLRLLRLQGNVTKAVEGLNEARKDEEATARDVIDAELSAIEAQIALEIAVAGATGAVAAGGQAFLDAGEKVDVLTERGRFLLAMIGEIPTDVEVNFFATLTGFERVEELLSGGSRTSRTREQVRRHGGPVTAGERCLGGEGGPELFIPDRAGRITPNNQLGGNTINVTVNQPETVDFASDLAAGLIMGQITQQVEAF